MKLTKLIAATAIFAIASSALIASAANAAACTIDANGVVQTDGQCEIYAGPPFVDPNASGGSSDPSMPPSDSGSTPMVTATPTPSATPTPTATPAIKAITPPRADTMRRHAIRVLSSLLNGSAMQRIEISDLVDPNNFVVCYFATDCVLDVPANHAWSFSMLSDRYFLASGRKGALVQPTNVLGSFIYGETATTDYETSYTYSFNYETLVLEVKGSTTTRWEFPTLGTNTQVGPITIPWNEPVSISSVNRMAYKLNWTNVPKGMIEDSEGVLSGRPTQPGTYVMVAKIGDRSKPRAHQLTLIVGPGLTSPAGLNVAPLSPTSAEVSLVPLGPAEVVSAELQALASKVSDNYFEVEVRNTKTGEKTIQTFDGSLTKGTLKGLIPEQTYGFRIRSVKISASSKSEFSSETILKMPAAKLKYGFSGAGVSGTQAWVKGTTDTILLTVKGKKSANISLSTPRGSVTPIEAAAFKKAFPKLSIDAKGKITGKLTALTTIQKLYTVKVGSLLVKLNFVTSK